MPVSDRLNIIICVFDSLSVFDSGLFNSGSLDASEDLPTLSRLRENSALFTRTYTPCPQSSPARASLFTGLDPCVHGLWTNGVTLPDNEQTFPRRLAAAGYTNCLVGRRQLVGVSQWTTEQVPADEYTHIEWAHGPLHRSRQNAYLAWFQQTAPNHYSSTFATQPDPDDTQATQAQHKALDELPDELSFNYWVGERIGEWVSSQPSSQPFMAVAGFSVGSLLGAEPPADNDSEAVNRRALQQADTSLGRILDQLADSNLASNTAIIVTAGRGNKTGCETNNRMCERSIRVPLLIHRPESEKQTVDTPISTLDIAPTILELTGVPVGPRMQGSSLLSVLNGAEVSQGWAISRLRSSSVSRGQNWQTALCTSNKKLVMLHGSTKDGTEATFKLFNLEADPLEQHDLASQESHAAELEVMIDLMIDARCALEDRTEPRIAEF